MNIPTIQPTKQSTKAVFEAKPVENSFEKAIAKQHKVNYDKYINSKLKG